MGKLVRTQMGKGICLLLLLLGGFESFGQGGASQEQIRLCMKQLVAAGNDSSRVGCSERLVTALMRLKFAAYDSSGAVQYLNYKKERRTGAEIFSWRVELEQGPAFYHVFKFGSGSDAVLRYRTGEKTEVPAYLFYDWAAFKSGGNYHYVLLGWGETSRTNRKAIWIAAFPGNGNIDFNRPLLRKGERRSPCFLFEYGKEVAMMLKQDRKGKRIIFDHLSPSDSRYTDYPVFYGPDGDIHAFELKKGEWWYREKIK